MTFRSHFQKICYLFLLLLVSLVLLCPVDSEDGIAYITYYPSSYRLVEGMHVSGGFPESVQSLDSDCLTVQSEPSEQFMFSNPSVYVLRQLTSCVSGHIPDLVSEDDLHMVFRSYFSGNNAVDFVDYYMSDVDYSADKGTHSNFTAQLSGPDSIFDTLTEENTGGASNATFIDAESFEGAWPPTGWTEGGPWDRESDQAYNGSYSADFDGDFISPSGSLSTPALNCSDANAIYVDFWYRDDDCDNGEFLLQYYNGTNWNTISDLGSTLQEDQWLHYQDKVTDSQYSISDFIVRWRAESVDFGEHVWVDLITIQKEIQSADNYELDLEMQWQNVSYQEINKELAVYVDRGNNTHCLNASGGYLTVGDGTPDWGSSMGTISFWMKWNIVNNRPWGQHDDMETRFSANTLILDWGYPASLMSNTIFSPDKWYFIAIAWNEDTDDLSLYVGDQDNPPQLDAQNDAWASRVSDVGAVENNFMASRGGLDPTDGVGDDLRYWNISRTLTDIQKDYNFELTGSESNLRSYFRLNNDFDDTGSDNNDGSASGIYMFSSGVAFARPPTENIQVDVWHGGLWQNLVTDLSEGWNNVSISSYVDSPTLTIRFKGVVEADDGVQDSWAIDAALLHVWSNEYMAEVEFAGSSDLENWSTINWTASIGWTVGSINVTAQLYSFSLGDYSSGGDGYLSYESSASSHEDEVKSQNVANNLDHFRNSTGHWKMKIKGVKVTDDQFDLEIDWIELKLSEDYELSTEYSFSDMTTDTAVRLNFTVTSHYSQVGVNVTIQAWNYSSSSYAEDVEASLSYTSDVGNETRTLSIITDPEFYVSNGTAKIRIRGVSSSQFLQEIDRISLSYGYSSVHPWGLPFGWGGILLYTVPAGVSLLFISVLILRRRNRKKPNIEDKMHPFAGSFGMSHEQMAGKKMLLEIDPTSDFQGILFNFASEANNRGEKLFIFTSRGSPLHSKFSGSKNTGFYLLASKSFTAKQGRAREALLPANDLSILLDTITKILRSKARKPINILFDNLSDTILLCGFEKTYKFIRWILEAVSSPNRTILFVFNPMAHDPKTSSSIRGLFQTRLSYGKDGPRIGTL